MCPACGIASPEFATGPGGREGTRCPHCGALGRHRFLARTVDGLGLTGRRDAVVFALDPPPPVRTLLERRFGHALRVWRPAKPALLGSEPLRLPLADRDADLIVGYGFLQRFADPAPALAEIARVLRPGAAALLRDTWILRHASADHLGPALTEPFTRARLSPAVIRARDLPADVRDAQAIDHDDVVLRCTRVAPARGRRAVARRAGTAALRTLRRGRAAISRRVGEAQTQSGLGPPVFVFGAPRSGTTYLVEVLNRHPQVLITNETRVMTFTNRALNTLGGNDWVLKAHRRQFLAALRSELPGVIERFYADLGARPGMRWGDKNPHYADSRTDPLCLATIDDLFGDSQFVNIVRDGRDVVSSIVRKGWTKADDPVDVWRRHVLHARQFGAQVGPERYLEIRYEDLVGDAEATVAGVLSFLGLGMHPEVVAFLASQRRERTPFSGPVTQAGQLGRPSWQERLSPEEAAEVTARLSDLLIEYGYLPSR